MALTKASNHKRKSGRRIAADLLNESRCTRCKRPAHITMPIKTTSGTKWISHCTSEACVEWAHRRKERGEQL